MRARRDLASDRGAVDALHDHVIADMALDETLDWVAALAVNEVRRAEFAIVVVDRDGRRGSLVGASDPLASHLYEAGRAGGDAPWVGSLLRTDAFVARTADRESPWPAFRAACLAQGVLSVLFVPLEVAGSLCGALGLYAESASAFSDREMEIAGEFAAAAAAVLTNAAAFWEQRALSESLEAALQSRAVIDQAKGIVMHTMLCGPDRAFRLIVEQSQFENRKVRDIAGEIVARTSGDDARAPRTTSGGEPPTERHVGGSG